MFRNSFKGLLLSTMLVSPAWATVTIISNDGNLRIQGELEKFENGNYHVSTAIGEFVIGSDQARCEGDACPEIKVVDYNFGIAATMGIDQNLISAALSSFLETTGNSAIMGSAGGKRVANVVDAESRLLGAVSFNQQSADDAFRSLLNGEVELIVTDRRATQAEVEAFIAAGKGTLTNATDEAIVAQDALVIATSPDNPVRSISMEDAEGIFSGRITNWSQLGGPDMKIKVIVPQEPSVISDQFFTAVLDPFFSDYDPNAERSMNEAELDSAIASNPAAIGVVSSAQLDASRAMILAKTCGIETEATAFNIRSEDYPLSRRIYAYSTGDNPAARQLMEYLNADAGQDLMDSLNYASLRPQSQDLNEFGKQLAYGLAAPDAVEEIQNLRRFAAEVYGANRLSTTFRFAPGSSQPDNKSRADAQRLAALLQKPEYQGVEVMLIGFTDSIGKGPVNQVLSQRRAGQVLDEILKTAGVRLDPTQFRVLGFGEAYPSDCNTDDAGRQLNRRVEVWIRAKGVKGRV
jgi:phosphate transport system substrate-binding protein